MYEMYRENILDHGMNPRNAGILDPADIDYEVHNHTCGDRLRLTLRLNEDNIITEIGWDGEGCAISQAAASMLGEEIIGKSLDEVRMVTRDDIFEMLGIPISQNRVKCALLSLKALHVGLYGLEYWRKLEDREDEE
jgi:nitrogen fixation protein NifU and related proteins